MDTFVVVGSDKGTQPPFSVVNVKPLSCWHQQDAHKSDRLLWVPPVFDNMVTGDVGLASPCTPTKVYPDLSPLPPLTPSLPDWSLEDLLRIPTPTMRGGLVEQYATAESRKKNISVCQVDTMTLFRCKPPANQASSLSPLYKLNVVDVWHTYNTDWNVRDAVHKSHPAFVVIHGLCYDSDTDRLYFGEARPTYTESISTDMLLDALQSSSRLCLVYLNVPDSGKLAQRIRTMANPPIVVHWGPRPIDASHRTSAMIEFVHCIVMGVPPAEAFKRAHATMSKKYALESTDLHMLVSRDDVRLNDIRYLLYHPMSPKFVSHNYRTVMGMESEVVKELTT
jgi:hypothetical protein